MDSDGLLQPNDVVLAVRTNIGGRHTSQTQAMLLKSDDIGQTGVYVRISDEPEPEWNTEYLDASDNTIIHINRDKRNEICSVMVIFPKHNLSTNTNANTT